jgi:PleD family two-component response regulator
VTLGVAAYPDDAKTRDDLIGKADKAMYEGKMSGRNKVVEA